MGQYNGANTGSMLPNTVLPATLYPGDDCYVFGTSFTAAAGPTPGQIQAPNDTNVLFETCAVGACSLAVNLASRPGGGNAPGVIIQVTASANPGVMEVDVQDAGQDSDGAYILPSGSTAYKITTWQGPLLDGSYTAWAELQPEGARFLRLKVITNPNAVKLKAKVSYV